MRPVILASGSARRIQLLKKTGLKFKVVRPEIQETIDPALSARENTQKLSQAKALAVAKRISRGVIIAADTLGELEGKILGKPRNMIEARLMLKRLSNRKHLVITTLTVIDAVTKRMKQKTVVTQVKFKKLNDAIIDQYFSQVDPLDKAAAYAIQDKGELLIASIKGDYYSVMGLPLGAVKKLLAGFGIKFAILKNNEKQNLSGG